jgi:hypothetical protein
VYSVQRATKRRCRLSHNLLQRTCFTTFRGSGLQTKHLNPKVNLVIIALSLSSLHISKMRKFLRTTTLLSLLGLSSTQSTSASWGEPFTVDNGATASQSQVTLLPSTTTSIHPIQSRVSGVSSFDVTSSGGSASSTRTSVGVQSTGGADMGVRKMGFVGVLAGAAGVLFV